MLPAQLVLTLLLVAQLPGPPVLTTRVTPGARLTVGDPFDVVLTLTRADSSQVIGPLVDSLGVFLPAAKQPKARARAGRGPDVHHLSLAAFRPGRHRLPTFTFLVRTGARVDTLRSDSAVVTVASVLPGEMKDINDLKPAEAFPNLWLWLVPGILLLAAGLVYAGSRLIRRFRRIREIAASPLPPWEQALAALDELPWQEWLAAGQIKRFYYALSQVLKRYIERRFEFNAVEQTTTEILASMRACRTPMRDEAGQFLTRSDFVKYARTVPPDEEARAAIAQVRDFVMKTKPSEPVPAVVATEAVAAPPLPGGSPRGKREGRP
jgi:hypothetical protein